MNFLTNICPMLWIKWSYATIWYGSHTNFEQISYNNKKYAKYSIDKFNL